MPVRFSSMMRPITPMRSCNASQSARSLSRATDERHATKGTKLRLSAPSRRSADSSSQAPTPIRTVSRTRRISPVETNMRTPSRSSMPRVINSPVCTWSWNEKLNFCSLS